MKMLRMVCALYLPMDEGETQEQASERMLELIEGAGVDLYSWWNVDTVTSDGGRKTGEGECPTCCKNDRVIGRKINTAHQPRVRAQGDT